MSRPVKRCSRARRNKTQATKFQPTMTMFPTSQSCRLIRRTKLIHRASIHRAWIHRASMARRSPMVWGHCDPGCDSICKGTQESFARWTPFHKLIQLQPLSRPVKTKICTSGNAAPSRRTAGFIVARYVGPSFVAPEGESIQFRCGELKLPWRGTVQQAG